MSIPAVASSLSAPSSDALTSASSADFVLLTASPLETYNPSELVGCPEAGAISSFIGTTRNTFQGKGVIRLEYEAYDSMAIKQMRSAYKQTVLLLICMDTLAVSDILVCSAYCAYFSSVNSVLASALAGRTCPSVPFFIGRVRFRCRDSIVHH
jgi:hypothetical protein